MELSVNFREHFQLLSKEWESIRHLPGIRLYSIENEDLFVSITNYGLRILHLYTKNADNNPVDVIVGPETPKAFFQSTNPYYGAIIGRYANRIDRGRFTLNGRNYQISCNNGAHHLHGGVMGFHNQVWESRTQTQHELVFTLTSAHGTEGYPGNLEVKVTFRLTGNQLEIQYEAATDAATVVNLTHHPFFNLNGCGSKSLESHFLQLEADQYLPVRVDMIPEGILQDVQGTPFDFRGKVSLFEQLQQKHQQLDRGHGFDHCFVRNRYTSVPYGFIAAAWSQRTGIAMRIATTEPGLQLYTGNFMDGTNTMKNGVTDILHSAFCLEPQHFPNSPNEPQFPNVVLEPDQFYKSSTTFEFLNHPLTHNT